MATKAGIIGALRQEGSVVTVTCDSERLARSAGLSITPMHIQRAE